MSKRKKERPETSTLKIHSAPERVAQRIFANARGDRRNLAQG